MNLRALVIGLLLTLAAPLSAFAQCSGQSPSLTYCGNPTGSQALPGWKPFSGIPFPSIAGGTVVGNRGTSAATASPLTNPILGIPGTSTGEVGFAGLTSGTATVRAQAAAGTPVLLLPNTSGTLASTATSPLAISATTGAVSITGLAGGVLAGSGPAFTATPVLGVPGALQGSLGFAGLTSGTVTVSAQAVAGTVALTLPNASGTVAANATTPLVLSATTGTLTCPTCVTSSGGGAISGTAPISVSGAGVVSINAPYATLTASNGGIVYSGATDLAILSGTATARQMLQSGASLAPAWSTAVWPATTTISQLLYSDVANNVTGLATANGGILNTSAAGVPSITPTPLLGVAGTTMGTLRLSGSTSGVITITPQATAGTATMTLPNASGTFAVSASAPLALSATTGALTVTGVAGQVLAGATPAFTNAPALGVAGSSVGSIAFANATSGSVTIQPVTGALGSSVMSIPASTGTFANIVASGTSALGTSAISSATCATVVTTAATNTATTDVVTAGFNGDPTAVTGYVPLTSGMLTIIVYPTANNVNFKVCNNTSSSITPGAITLNWRVLR